MKHLESYKNRFFNLLESELGNVKPLISEQIDFSPRPSNPTVEKGSGGFPNNSGTSKYNKFDILKKGTTIKAVRVSDKLKYELFFINDLKDNKISAIITGDGFIENLETGEKTPLNQNKIFELELNPQNGALVGTDSMLGVFEPNYPEPVNPPTPPTPQPISSEDELIKRLTNQKIVLYLDANETKPLKDSISNSTLVWEIFKINSNASKSQLFLFVEPERAPGYSGIEKMIQWTCDAPNQLITLRLNVKESRMEKTPVYNKKLTDILTKAFCEKSAGGISVPKTGFY